MPGGVEFGESVWRVSRQPAVSVGARFDGDAPPQPQSGALWFHSDKGESRFLPMDELPTEHELQDIDTFLRYLEAAERR